MNNNTTLTFCTIALISFAIRLSAETIYVSGYTTHAGNDETNITRQPCYWKDGVRHDLLMKGKLAFGEATVLAVSGTDIYIAGFTRIEKNSNNGESRYFQNIPCYWKNGIWHKLEAQRSADDGGTWGIGATRHTITITGHYMTTRQGWFMPDSRESHPCYWENGSLHRLPVTDSWIQGKELDDLTGKTPFVFESEKLNLQGKELRPWHRIHGKWKPSPVEVSGYYSSMSMVNTPLGLMYIRDPVRHSPGVWIKGTRYEIPFQSSTVPRVLAAFITESQVLIGGRDLCGEWNSSNLRTDNPELPKIRIIAPPESEVTGLYVLDGNVYACGVSSQRSGMQYPLAWKNGVVIPLAMPEKNHGGAACSIVVK